MAANKLQRAERIFTEALEHKGDQRAAHVRAASGGDEDLLAHVQRLLAAHDAAGRFMVEPTVTGDPRLNDRATPGAISEELSSMVGPYKLLQNIGEGGFGTVYMAEQQTPVVRRVALKVIKLGMDTKQVIARFEAERQALAMMDHPHIAKVFDAGATETGRPYFVMELVRGVPITEYCDTNNLSATERLELVVPVCHAVQHAHQKGIIHRDIKPSNVLVTMHDGRPVPKVIDFGIAKATNARLTEKTLFTEHRQLIGTPAYMSPEQAEMSGLDIDTRTDVYSLGVLLYELLTGTTPFDARRLREAGYAEIQRIIREVEPDRPSTRIGTLGTLLASVAAHRHTEPRKLGALLRGDLDWIVMKAMEKDRTRRYETASALSADLRSHLIGEPVSAAPPSTLYKVRKFIRRHKVGVVTGSTIAVVLVLGVIGTTVGMFRTIESQREQGRLRAKAVEADAAAEAEKRIADALRRAAELQELRSNLGGASTAISVSYDSPGAIEQLERIPESSRGWEWRYLRRQADVSIDTFSGHTDRVRCLAVSPDGALIASGADDGKVRIWDAATGTVVREFKVHKRAVDSVAWNPAGTRISTGSEGGGIGFWDTATGNPVRPDNKEHNGMVRSVAFSPDGSCFVSGSYDKTIKIWDAKTGDRIGELETGAEVMCVSFSPDGTLASAHSGMSDLARKGGRVLLWRSPLGHVAPEEFATASSAVEAVAFSPEGDRLAFVTFGGKVRVSSVSTRQSLSVFDTHANANFALQFSPDGRRLVSGGRDGVVRLWDLDAAEPLATLIGHAKAVSGLAFSRDGARIFSSSWDTTLKVWEAASDQGFGAGADAERISSVAFSPDGARIAGILMDGRVRWWDSLVGEVGPGGPLAGGALMVKGDMSVGTLLVISPSGTHVATVARKGAIELGAIELSDADTGERVRVLHGHTKVVKCLAFNHDGTRLASGGLDGTIRLWDVSTGAETAAIGTSHSAWAEAYEFNSECYSIVFSPDGSMLAWGGLEEATVCDGITLRKLHTFRFPQMKGLRVAFSPNQSQLAICAGDGKTTLWNPRTGQQLGAASGTVDWGGTRASFSPVETRLVLSSGAGVMRVLDTVRMTELVALNHPSGTFSPDGSRLAHGVWAGESSLRMLDTVPESERYRERQAIRAAEPEARRILIAALASDTDYALIARRFREDAALDAPVRRLALHLLLARSLAEQEEIRSLVATILKPLWASNPVGRELAEAVRTAPSVPERLRERAMRYASQESRPLGLNTSAWAKVRRADGSPVDYRRGLVEADEAVRLMPNNGYAINTLGVAHFRVGEYEAALATLRRADEINSRGEPADAPNAVEAPPQPAGLPEDVAFLAMALHKLGRAEEAAAAMERLHALMSLDRGAKDSDSQSVSREAELMVSAK